MELFKNARIKIGKSVLKKKLARLNRKVSYSAFGQVKKIGIVWDASNPSEFASLSRFHQQMHERNIDISILGYYPGKELPDQYTAIRFLTCIRKHEINLLYHPVSAESTTFINNRFDILIDINFKKLLPLQYISSLSCAFFKVGLFESGADETPFDLMMELKAPVSIDNYLSQTVQYLEMINAGTVDRKI
jgi:hypothetical protein